MKTILPYAKYCTDRFNQIYLVNKIESWIVHRLFVMLVDYVKEKLLLGESVNIYGLGTFEITKSNKLKFRISPHLISHFKEATNDLTDCSSMRIKKKREQTRSVWDQRINYQLKLTNKTIASIIKTREELNSYNEMYGNVGTAETLETPNLLINTNSVINTSEEVKLVEPITNDILE